MTPARKRRRWLKKRKRKGLKRPLPLRVGIANLDGASGGSKAKAEARVRLRLKRSIKRGRPDILKVVEATTAHGLVDLATVIPKGWEVSQDTRSVPRAGSAILVRRERASIRRSSSRLASPALYRGKRANRMRDRWIRRAVLRIDPGTKHRWRRAFAVSHGPPKRNWFPWGALWWTAMKLVGAVCKSADFNRRRRYVRRQFPRRKVRQKGLLGIVVARWIPASPVEVIDIGGDHEMTVTTLWPN